MVGIPTRGTRGFLHSTTRCMYLEYGCTRFCAGGGRWPGRRNEKGPKYVQIRKPVTKCERMRSGGTELWCPRLRDERGAPLGQARPTPTRPEPSGGGRGPLQVIMNIITMTINKSRMRLTPVLSRALLSSVPAATSKARAGAIGGGGHRGHPGRRAGPGGGPRGTLSGTCARGEAR